MPLQGNEGYLYAFKTPLLIPITFKLDFLLKMKFGRLFVNDGDWGPEAWGQKRAEAEWMADFKRHHTAAEAKHISYLSKAREFPDSCGRTSQS